MIDKYSYKINDRRFLGVDKNNKVIWKSIGSQAKEFPTKKEALKFANTFFKKFRGYMIEKQLTNEEWNLLIENENNNAWTDIVAEGGL